MTFTITLLPDEDWQLIAECPAMPGCVSQGHTEQEALANIRLAIRECLTVRAEFGMPLTVITQRSKSCRQRSSENADPALRV